MGSAVISSAVTLWVLWNMHVVNAKLICKPKDTNIMDPDCQNTCDTDPMSPFCYSLCDCSGKANETCASLDSSPREVEENATEGTPLFQIPVSSGERWEFRLGRTESVDGSPLLRLQGYLKLLHFANKYEMVLNRPLDIESIYKDFGIILTSLLLRLTCSLGPAGDSETTEIFLIIKPVNEFAPEFKGPLEMDVNEDAKVGNPLITLRFLAQDRDVNPSGTELAYFGLHKYLPKSSLDGSSYFFMADTQHGAIELKKAVDYEALRPLDATTLYLNVSATDVHGLSTFAVLTVHVKDVDDLPPEFYHPGCPVFAVGSKPCVVAYEVEVFVDYQGPFTKLFPYRVQARDMDFLNATITFALEEAPGQNPEVLGKFSINRVGAQISLISPFHKPQVVRLVIVAMQPSGNSQTRFARASLQVSVVSKPEPFDVALLRPDPLTPTKTKSADDEKEGVPLYLIITLVVGFLFLVVHVIICVICLKYKGDKRQRVSPEHPEGPSGGLLYKSPGGMVSLNTNTRPQEDAIQTTSYLMASEYSVNPDGKVMQSNYSVKHASGMLQSSSNMKETFPSLGSDNMVGLFPEHNAIRASVPNFDKAKTDKTQDRSENSNQTCHAGKTNTCSHVANEIDANPPTPSYHGDVEESPSESNKTSPPSNVSSLSTNTRTALSLDSDDEVKARPHLIDSHLMNGSAFKQIIPLVTPQEQEIFSEHRLNNSSNQTRKVIHESDEQSYLAYEGHNCSPEDMNIPECSTPSRSGSPQSSVYVRNTTEGSKLDQGPSVKMVKDGHTDNREQTISESQRVYRSKNSYSAQNALSIFPLEKLSSTTDENSSILNLSRRLTALSGSIVFESSGNKLPHLSQVPTAIVLDQAEPDQVPDEVNILKVNNLKNQVDDRQGKRKRKKKRAKAERNCKMVGNVNYPEHGSRSSVLLPESYAAGDTKSHDKKQRRELFQTPNDQYVNEHIGDVDSSELTYKMNRSLPCRNIIKNETRSRRNSYDSLHGTPMPDLQVHLPPRSVSSLPYNVNKPARLDKSRLQPYMILQYEKQRELKEQYQEQQQRQNLKRHKVKRSKQEKHTTETHFEDQETYMQRHNFQQQQKYVDQDTAVGKYVQYSSEQQLNHQHRLGHGAQHLRSVSVPCAVKATRENAHTQQLPATAPPIMKNEDAQNLTDKDEDLEQDVQNWVNSTH